jgi:hypothetical protein
MRRYSLFIELSLKSEVVAVHMEESTGHFIAECHAEAETLILLHYSHIMKS